MQHKGGDLGTWPLQQRACSDYRILDKASEPIRKIRNEAAEMDKMVKQAGKSLDNLDSSKVTTSIKTTNRNVENLGKTTEKTATKVKVSTNEVGKSFERMAGKGTASIKELTEALRRFEHERATATLDVNIAKAEAKIRILKQQIRSFSTAQARSELEAMGFAATTATEALVGSAGGGGGGPPGVRGGLAGGFFAAGGRAAFMAAALVTAAPAIVAFTGVISALVGSLGMAVGGAGALGIGVMGAFVVGIGTMVSVIKPAMTALKEVKKAQDDYNKSIQQYGANSAQAISKAKALQKVQQQNKGAASVANNAKVVSGRWKRLTAPAREDFFGILNAGLETANDLLPTFGRIATGVFARLRVGVEDFLRPFRGAEWRGIFRDLGDTFARITGPALRSLGSLTLFFGRIARAASPMVIRMFEKLERWTSGLARSVGDQAKTSSTIERLVGHLRDWVHLGGAAVRLMATFFGAGAAQGQDVVQGITAQFEKWTQWMKDNPEAIHNFFTRTINAAGKLVHALGQIAKVLGQVADAMLPLLNLVSSLVSLTGGAGLLGPLALLGGAKFAGPKLAGMFGRGGAAAASSAATSGVAGAGAVAAGAGAARGGSFLNSAIRATGGVSRLGSAGKLGLTVARGIGTKVALPLALGSAALDFLTTRGTLGERSQNAMSGATFGLIPRAHTRVENRESGNTAAQQLIQRTGGDPRALQSRIASLQHSLAAKSTSSNQFWTGDPTRHTTPKLSGDAREKVQAQLNALKPVLRVQIKAEQTNKASKAFDDMMKGFDNRWNRLGSKRAGTGLVHSIQRQLKDLGPEGDRALLKATASWTQTMETGSRAQRRVAKRTKDAVVAAYHDMGRDVRVIDGNIVDITRGKWGTIRSLISSEAERAAQEGRKAFTDLQNAARDALKNMGYSGSEANKLVSQMEKTGPSSVSPNTAAGQSGRRAGSVGPVGGVGPAGDGWGDGMGDNHAAVTAAKAQKASQGAGNLMGASPDLAPYAQDASSYGLHVSSGSRPGAITNAGNVSYHASGRAIDLAGSPADMLRYARHAASAYGSRLEELIHSPLGFSIKNGQKVAPYAVADHYDHVHVADAQAGVVTGGGAGGGGSLGGAVDPISLKRRKSRAGGAFGVASNRVEDIIAGAMETKLNNAIGAGGGGGGYNPHGKVLTFEQVAKLAESVGLPGVTFAQIAKGESGFQPHATGHDPGGTTGLGLWQITTKFNDDIIKRLGGVQAMYDPLTNARAAKMIYDRQGIKAWYGTKYMTDPNAHFTGDGIGDTRNPAWGGWHGRGGSFTTHKPTLIGVGDGGRERVTITPEGKGGRGAPIHVTIGKIVNYEEGDIKRILERELAALASSLNNDDSELD